MTRRKLTTAQAGSAIIGATAVALAGSPAAASPQPELHVVPPLVSSPTPSFSPTAIGANPGALGVATSKSEISYTVRAGDTVWALAKTHGVNVSQIIEANGLGSNAMIRIGQKLTIPKAGSAGQPSKSTSSQNRTHTVKSGQTLSAIAAKYGVSTSKLAALNGLSNPNFIRAGQVLKLSGTSPSSTGSSSAKPTPADRTTYTVKSGDTVWAIASQNKSTVSAIISANNLSSSGFIRVGQKLKIPSGASVTTSAPKNSCQNVVPNTFLHYTYPADVVRAANENKCTLDAMSVPSRNQMQNLVRQTAVDMGVNPALAQAVAFQESGFNHRAVSPANAIGTMQVIPSSGDWAGQLLGRKINLLDPRDNAAAGVAILRSLQRTFPDNLDYAIGAYYQGAGSVSKYGLASDTRSYVTAIKAHMARFN